MIKCHNYLTAIVNLSGPNGENLQGHWLRVVVFHPMVGLYRNIIPGANKLSNWKPYNVSVHDLGEILRGRGRRGIGMTSNMAKECQILKIG